MCARAGSVSGTLAHMNRRHFLYGSMAFSAASAARSSVALANAKEAALKPMDVRQFHASRKFADLPSGRIAYVERGRGTAALFLHGYPLNGYQWRGALSRLSAHRRCIAPDFLGLGYTEVPEGADLRPGAQMAMLAQFLDRLGEETVDIVANDSGGAVAQLFAAHHPKRVRTLLLTNCDANTDCPPQAINSLIADVRRGGAAEKYVARPLADHALARSPQGLVGACFTYPDRFLDETLDCYLGAFTRSPLRMRQYELFALALEKNVLLGIETSLRRFESPVRILWGTGDTIFSAESPDWLSHTFPSSRGVRRVEGAKLFWPEEFPDLIAEEARNLWGVLRHLWAYSVNT
jgi:haloalkane dehalogenase